MRVSFHPQVWINDYAIEVDPLGDTDFEVGDIPDSWRDDTYESDSLRDHPNAPQWVRDRNAMIAEVMVQACIEQELPGTKFLYLTKGSQTRAAVRAKLRRHNPKAAKLAAAQRKASKRVAKHK